MDDLLALLLDPWQQPFMRRAFLAAVMSSAVCGVIGTHVVLRGMAFIGDTIAHAVFPGVAVAFVLRANLAIGGAIAGLLTALTVGVVSQNRRLREDTVIGVFFAAAFGLGVVILSAAPGYGGSLESFLFGQILGISDDDVLMIAVVAALLVAGTLAIHRQLVTVSLDRETARALGLPVFALDLALYALVTIAIVISLQAVGNILVLALLITPAATARLLTDRLATMMVLAPLIGAMSALAGLYLSWALDLAAGGLIVLATTSCFIAAWLLSPRHGVIPARRRARGSPQPSE